METPPPPHKKKKKKKKWARELKRNIKKKVFTVFFCSFNLNISILHRLKNRFYLTTYTKFSRFCFLGTTPVLAPNVWANEKTPKLTPAPGNRTRNYEADTLPHDHEHHTSFNLGFRSRITHLTVL